MNTALLDKKFEQIGARIQFVDDTRTRRRRSGALSINIIHDRRGEVFEIRFQEDAKIDVLDLQPADRHLLLLVRGDGEKSKYLCGHDERHWFVAGIPESAPVGTVPQAK